MKNGVDGDGGKLVWGFVGMFWLSVALFGGLVLLRGNMLALGLQYIQTTTYLLLQVP